MIPGYSERFLFNPYPTGRSDHVWKNNEGVELGVGITSGKTNAILCLYGNSGCTLGMLPFVEKFSQHADAYCLEYPGFGTLYGETPSVKRCVKALHLGLSDLSNYDSITVVAQSIGTLVLSEGLNGIPHPEKIKRIILITPFDNIADVASHLINLPTSVTHFALPSMSSSQRWKEAWVSLNHVEVVVVAAEQDEVTGFDQAMKLAETLKIYPLKVEKVDGGHNDALQLDVLQKYL